MRIDRLLSDLEAEAAGEKAAAARLERAEAVRAERAAVTLADRLRAGIGGEVVIDVAGLQARGRLADVGVGWAALDRVAGRVVLDVSDVARAGMSVVALDALESVTGLTLRHRGDGESEIGRTWTSLLRAAARTRIPAVWTTRSGVRVYGVIDAVGHDHAVMTRGDGNGQVVTIKALALLEFGGAGSAAAR